MNAFSRTAPPTGPHPDTDARVPAPGSIRLVQFTGDAGGPVYINPLQVESVCPADFGTRIILASRGASSIVRESIGSVVAALRGEACDE